MCRSCVTRSSYASEIPGKGKPTFKSFHYIRQAGPLKSWDGTKVRGLNHERPLMVLHATYVFLQSVLPFISHWSVSHSQYWPLRSCRKLMTLISLSILWHLNVRSTTFPCLALYKTDIAIDCKLLTYYTRQIPVFNLTTPKTLKLTTTKFGMPNTIGCLELHLWTHIRGKVNNTMKTSEAHMSNVITHLHLANDE